MPKYPTVKVSDLVESGDLEIKTGPFGTQLAASEYVEHGVPVINVRNIGFGNIKEDKLEYINDETVTRLAGHLLKEGDIVFGRKGAVERHVLIRFPQKGWFQGSDCLRIRINRSRFSPTFASYYFLTSEHQRWMMNQCSHGATMASLNQDIIKRIVLPDPVISIQQKIAAILSAYDDLIENNTRRIAILEEMARLIYREWFVNFRFPGYEKAKFIDSAIGKIPAGWEVKKLSNIAKVYSGFPFKSGTFSEGGKYGVVTIKNVQDGNFLPDTSSRIEELPSKIPAYCLLENGDILLSLTGNVGRVCLVYGENLVLNQRVAKIEALSKVNYEFIYCLLRDPEFQKKLISISTGVAQQNLSPIEMATLPILCPSNEVFRAFHEQMNSSILLLINLLLQNRLLRQTRDLLLPRLISGEIDVSEMEIEIKS